MNVCALPSCREEVSNRQAFCIDHYRLLPGKLRRALYNSTADRNRIRAETIAQSVAALEALV